MVIALVVLGIVAVLVAALLLYASTRPDYLHVERSVDIAAPPENIFPLIDDLHEWVRWTPYNKDPDMRVTYSGAVSGPGAHYAWVGDKRVGEGEITLKETTQPNKLIFDLHMIKPFEGRNVATFTLKPSANSTTVTWSLDDKHKLIQKVMTIFFDLDRLIGRDFEVGLERLKKVVESGVRT